MGFINNLMKRVINPKKHLINRFTISAEELKNDVSKISELTGRPLMKAKNAKHFHFFFTKEIKEFEQCYVNTNVYLILQRITGAEGHFAFEDAHIIEEYFLETIANRLYQASKMHFNDATWSKQDPAFIKQKVLWARARRASGLEVVSNNVEPLQKWHSTLEGISGALDQYSDTSVKAAAIKFSKHNILDLVEDMQSRQQRQDKLILDGETVIINFDLQPRVSRTRSYSMTLSWQDVKHFYLNSSFFTELFTEKGTFENAQRYFSSTPPRAIFIALLRHILSFCIIYPQRLYRSPIMLLDQKTRSQRYLKNTYAKFTLR